MSNSILEQTWCLKKALPRNSQIGRIKIVITSYSIHYTKLYDAPFIRYDNLSYAEVKQALQEFVFNLNVPTRVGFQSPFTNITFDLKVPKHLKEQPVIIGGNLQNLVYGDFQNEMSIFNQARNNFV